MSSGYSIQRNQNVDSSPTLDTSPFILKFLSVNYLDGIIRSIKAKDLQLSQLHHPCTQCVGVEGCRWSLQKCWHRYLGYCQCGGVVESSPTPNAHSGWFCSKSDGRRRVVRTPGTSHRTTYKLYMILTLTRPRLWPVKRSSLCSHSLLTPS